MKKFFFLFFYKSWWVYLFALGCTLIFEQTLRLHQEEIQKLTSQLLKLHEEKEKLIGEQEELKMHLISQNDPQYIEKVLIEDLGVIPRNAKKIVFYSPN